jgi:multidrug efflux pump subunit AcrB
VAFIGGGPGGSAGNTGSAFIELKPLAERKATADQIIARLRPKLAKVAGINMFLQAMQDVRIGGRLTRTQYQYTLQDAKLDELSQWAPRVLETMRKLPQLKDVASDQQTAGLELDVNIDRDTAARLGITPQAVDDTLYDAFGQRQVATSYTQVNSYRVVLEVKPELQKSPDALARIYVKSAAGGMVPLSAIASTKIASTSLSVNHQGQFPSVTLSFNLAPGYALGQAVDAIQRATLSAGMPASVHGAFAGTAQAFQSSIESEKWLILAALLAVYIVLGVLYESLVHPVTILSTLPSAGVGALLALLVCHMEFSIIALIGIVLLIGIVKKNAIMMIDFALEAERERGVSTREHGTGAELRRPLGITIVGGLLISQMLTLFTTPVIYVVLDRFTRRHRHAIKAPGPPSSPPPSAPPHPTEADAPGPA